MKNQKISNLLPTKIPLAIIAKKVLISFIFYSIFVLGKKIPIPYVDHKAINTLVESGSNYTSLNYISGGSLSKFSFFALNIFPLLNSSIILQFLIPIIPALEKYQKEEGEFGKKRLKQIGKLITLVISIIQALALISSFNSFIDNKLLVLLLLVSGSMCVAWICDILTDRGIVSGTSLLLSENILSNPKLISDIMNNLLKLSVLKQFLNIGLVILIVIIVVGLLESKVEIPIITSRQLISVSDTGVSTKTPSIPLKLNQGGILPIALATAASILPITIFGKTKFIVLITPIISTLFTIIFNYFYTIFLWDPKRVSDDLRKVSSSIPQIRPGETTEQYLNKLVQRYSILGGIFLSVVTVIPICWKFIFQLDYLVFDTLNITSLIIVLGTVLEIEKNILEILSASLYSSNKTKTL